MGGAVYGIRFRQIAIRGISILTSKREDMRDNEGSDVELYLSLAASPLLLAIVFAVVACCMYSRHKKRRRTGSMGQAATPDLNMEDNTYDEINTLPRRSMAEGAYALIANVSVTNAITYRNGMSQDQGQFSELDHTTIQERTKMEKNSNVRENKGRKPLPPSPLPSRRNHMIQRSDSDSGMMHRSFTVSHTPNGSTDHLYDSLDTPVDPDHPLYRTIDPKSNKVMDSPSEGHIYHVLEGPTSGPATPFASKYPSNTTKPAHPPPRMLAIVNRPTVNAWISKARATQGSNVTRGFQRSLSTSATISAPEHVSSESPIYAEVSEDKPPSLALPPKHIKSPVMPRSEEEQGKAEDVHIYHVLEVESPNDCRMGNLKKPLKQQQQTKNWKLKENSHSVSQMAGNGTESNGTICSGQTVSCKPKPVNLKVRPAVEMEEENEYAKPSNHRQEIVGTPVRPQFDDLSGCSQQSPHLSHTTSSKTVEQPAFDTLLYATPTTGERTQPVFDDPQYDCSQGGTPLQPERPTLAPLVEFDDPKYQAPLSLQSPHTVAGGESERSASHRHATISIPVRLFDDPKYASGFPQTSSEVKTGSMNNLVKHDHLKVVYVRPRSNSLFDDPKYAPPESNIQLKQTLL